MVRTERECNAMPLMSGNSRMNVRADIVEKRLHYRKEGIEPAGYVKKQCDDWRDGGAPRSIIYLSDDEAAERAKLTGIERKRWREARSRKRERRRENKKKPGKTTHRVTKCSCCGVIEHRDKHACNNLLMLALVILEFGLDARPFFLPKPMRRYNSSSAAVVDKNNSNASSAAAASSSAASATAASAVAASGKSGGKPSAKNNLQGKQ